jgi:hypothetical protein
MSTILTLLGGLFGFKSGATLANTATGAINWVTLAGGATYVLRHSDQQIPLGTISLGALSLIGVVLFLLVEAFRRASPGAGG